jgi:hypothetical protein
MNRPAQRFATVLTALLVTVCLASSLFAAAKTATIPPTQQQLQQMRAQQVQLQTDVAELKGQIDALKAQIPRPQSWTEKYVPSLAVFVSIIAAVLSVGFNIVFFILNRDLNKQIAERTVTIEAQKLLLEINKQYLSCPDLFAIYDDVAAIRPGAIDDNLKKKIEALGYMKLNIFELVYEVLPNADPWKAYFEDSLKRCQVLREELNRELGTGLYNRKLIKAYTDWLNKYNAAQAAIATPPQGAGAS